MKHFVTILALVALTACRDPAPQCAQPTATGLAPSSSFDVTLEGVAPASVHPELETGPTCGTLDGLAPGETVSLTTSAFFGTEPSRCLMSATIDAPAISSIGTPTGSPTTSDAELWTVTTADFGGGCTGAWDFAIVDTSGGPLVARRFTPAGGTACASATGTSGPCVDYFFAAVEPR